MLKYTELKFAGRQDLKKILPLVKPFTVLIEPTSLCNFRCIQCFHSLQESNYFSETKGHMPLDRFKRILTQLTNWSGPKLKVLKLSLYGEPMANKDFPTMLKLAREAAIAERIEVTTNASLLDEEMAHHLIDAQLDYLRVSIYATNQQAHQEITGNKMSIDRIWTNLSRLKQIKLSLNTTKPFVTCKKLDDFSGDNDIFLSRYQDIADECFIDKPHGWVKADKIDFIQRYYKDGIDLVRQDMKSRESDRTACPMPFTTMAIRSNGAVSPCCVDYAGGTNIGHVDTESLQAIWESKAWCDFQEMHLKGEQHSNGSCAVCDVYKDDHYTRDTIDGFPVENLLHHSLQRSAQPHT